MKRLINSGQKYGKIAMSSSPEIEELHRVACDKGLNTYIDPKTGYTVITEYAHRNRGVCCGNGCRHCPFDHVNVAIDSPNLEKVPGNYNGMKNKGKASQSTNDDVVDRHS